MTRYTAFRLLAGANLASEEGRASREGEGKILNRNQNDFDLTFLRYHSLARESLFQGCSHESLEEACEILVTFAEPLTWEPADKIANPKMDSRFHRARCHTHGVPVTMACHNPADQG